MATIGNLVVDLGLDHRKFDRGLSQSRGSLADFAGGLKGQLAGMGTALAGALSVGGLTGMVQLAAEAETTAVSFEVLLGSASRAKKLLGELTEFAASTPLGTQEINSAARSLIAFGIGADEVTTHLRRVGDIAAGIGAPIGEIAELYGKARVQGRLFGEDINQLTGRGIPIIQQLAKQFGVAESNVKKLVETGQVNFGHLEQAFKDLTSEGGMFGGMLDKNSKTLSGRWSTLVDEVTAGAREMGVEIVEALDLKSLIENTTAAIGVARELLGPLLPVIARMGVLLGTVAAGWLVVKAATLAYAAAQGVANTAAIIFQVVTNPANLALVAAGILAAGAAALYLSDQFAAAKAEAEAASLAAKAAASAAPPAGGGGAAGSGSGAGDGVPGGQLAADLEERRREMARLKQAPSLATFVPNVGVDEAQKRLVEEREKLGRLQQQIADLEGHLGQGGNDDVLQERIARRREAVEEIRAEMEQLQQVVDRGPLTDLQQKIVELERILLTSAGGWGEYGEAVRAELDRLKMVRLDELAGELRELTDPENKLTEAQKRIRALWAALNEAHNIRLLNEDLGNELVGRIEAQIGEATGITGAAEQVQQQIDLITGSVTELKLKLRGFAEAGATPEQVERYRQLTEELERAKKAATLKERGEDLAESLRTPAEVLKDRLAEIKELADAGQISAETRGRAELDAAREFAAARARDNAHAPGAIEEGTQEAVRAIAEFRRNAEGDSAAAEALANAKAQLAEAEKQTALLEEMAGAAPVEPADVPASPAGPAAPLPVDVPGPVTVTMPDPPTLTVTMPGPLPVDVPDPIPVAIPDPPTLTVDMAPPPPRGPIDVSPETADHIVARGRAESDAAHRKDAANQRLLADAVRRKRAEPADDRPRAAAERAAGRGRPGEVAASQRDHERQLAEQRASRAELERQTQQLDRIATREPVVIEVVEI